MSLKWGISEAIGSGGNAGIAGCVQLAAAVRRPPLGPLHQPVKFEGARGWNSPSAEISPLHILPRGKEREREGERSVACGFWRLSSHRRRARRALSPSLSLPLSLFPSLAVAASEDASESALGPKTPHAREMRDIRSTPLHSTPTNVVSFRLPPPFVRSLHAFTFLCTLQLHVSSDDMNCATTSLSLAFAINGHTHTN